MNKDKLADSVLNKMVAFFGALGRSWDWLKWYFFDDDTWRARNGRAE